MSDELLKSYNNRLANEPRNDAFYTLIVDKDDVYDTTTRYIVLDKVEAPTVSLSTQISSYPLINGDVISDHKYDMPANVSLKGSFSMNGRFNDTFTSFKGDYQRLENIQDYFENVRKYGKTITLIAQYNGQDRFKKRDNLVIKNINWTIGINSLAFSFELQQVYFAEFDSEIQIDEDLRDPDAPTLASTRTLDFVEDVITTDGVYEIIIKQMNEVGLIAQSFLDVFEKYIVANTVISLIGVVAVSLIVGSLVHLGLIAATASAALAATGVGLIVVAGVIAVVALVSFIGAIVEAVARGSYISEFKDLGNDTQNEKEVSRFANLLEYCKNQIASVGEYVDCYGFSSNNDKQQMYLSIDDTVYVFKFEKDNTTGFWQMTIADLNNEDRILKTVPEMTGNGAFLDCQKSDAIYSTSKGTRIYLINKAIYSISNTLNNDYELLDALLTDAFKSGDLSWLGYDEDTLKKNMDSDGNPTSTFLTQLRRDYKNGGYKKNLTYFELFVTSVDPSELSNKISETLTNCFKNKARFDRDY